MTVAIVIPCYNVSSQIEEVMSSVSSLGYHIIAVNDGSKDNTLEILTRLSKSNHNIQIINQPSNKGVGSAMKAGFVKALELNCEYIVKLDGDGQMDPRNIIKLLEPLKKHKADYTKGNRFHDFKSLRRMPFIRRIGNIGLSFLIKAASGYWNIFDPSNGFIAINNQKLSSIDLNKIDDRYFFESSMLIELYYTSAIVKDVPLDAIYKNEISNLSITKTLFEFPPKLLYALVKRVILKYFLYDFNIASVYLLFGLPLFLGGSLFGIKNFIKFTQLQMPAPTGTVVIPALLIILGFQLLLSALSYDLNNYPMTKNEK